MYCQSRQPLWHPVDDFYTLQSQEGLFSFDSTSWSSSWTLGFLVLAERPPESISNVSAVVDRKTAWSNPELALLTRPLAPRNSHTTVEVRNRRIRCILFRQI